MGLPGLLVLLRVPRLPPLFVHRRLVWLWGPLLLPLRRLLRVLRGGCP